MLRLITDFDGVLVDISERYYQVYHFCLDSVQHPAQMLNRLSKSEFWDLKRSQTPESEIGVKSGLNPDQVRLFVELRRQHAHTLPYFKYDVLIPGVIESLHQLQAAGVDIVVMTLRRDRELDYALVQYPELAPFFPPERRFCVPDAAIKDPDMEEKPKLMARALQALPAASVAWMVGDTEADVLCARFAEIPALSVLSGIRDRPSLEQLKPDRIFADFAESVQWVLNR